jgi:imidazolonepropionase
MMSMACQLFSMTIPEVWAGVTFQAAGALGLSHQIGSIEAGKIADLVLWSVKDSAALCYYFAYPIPHKTMIAGEWVS